VGGSGTRLVAELARSLGVRMGDDLNPASDTLWFTLLFKWRDVLRCSDEEFSKLVVALRAGLSGGQPLDTRAKALLVALGSEDRPGHSAVWLGERVQSLIAAAALPPHGGRWGWKEPNTHIVIDRLWRYLPELRYVHVVRHGMDMAFSRNQNQVQLWGPAILGTDAPLTPQRSLAYWCSTQRRAQRLLAENPHRMFWLDYDALCARPGEETEKLCIFLEADIAHALPVLPEVRPPGSSRHANKDLGLFPDEDLDYVRSLGYRIETGCLDAGSAKAESGKQSARGRQ
jgi:hypothetical protein